MNNTVVVAMSGGVDSSVAAALLKQQGYRVIGMMLRLWSEPCREESNRCCTPASMALARRVAARLDIPFHVVDVKEMFYDTVVKSFLEGYAMGLTPNPCVICNRLIKWEFLLSQAVNMGADLLASGHYARKQAGLDGKWQLLRGLDRTKDQSYVLHVLTQNKLERALFPIGGLQKKEVRAIAEKFDLPTAQQSDSQDLCFLSGKDYRDFLKRNAPGISRPGPITGRDGKIIGQHEGLPYYTIGQRKGLGVSSAVPLYVLEKKVSSNTLIVGIANELGSKEMVVGNVTWISGVIPEHPFFADVKTRYTAHEARAEVIPIAMETRENSTCLVKFETDQRDLTPGQAAVFFDGDLVLGGGTIQQTSPGQPGI